MVGTFWLLNRKHHKYGVRLGFGNRTRFIERKVYMPLTLILSICLDPVMLDARNLILRSAGYTVVPALSLKEAVDRFRSGDFDLVLLGHTVTEKDQDRLACLIRASGSRIPVVSIAAPGCGSRNAFIDATVGADPDELLAGIREALLKPAGKPAAATATYGNVICEATRRFPSPQESARPTLR
jgi:DNA-binding response OmpR family regulator